IVSPNIPFSDGKGPKWSELSWNHSTPGSSSITYQVLYRSGPDTYALIPDVDLPGNSAGFTTSPVDLSDVNVSTYDTLRIIAHISGASGTCPILQDWTVEWSEGVAMSGTLLQSDRLTAVASGTIRVAVNSTLLPTTGSVTNGVWSVNNVTA